MKVTHPGATVTHEAAIRTADRERLETLMTRGMACEQAVDLIVRGLLGGAPLAGEPARAGRQRRTGDGRPLEEHACRRDVGPVASRKLPPGQEGRWARSA